MMQRGAQPTQQNMQGAQMLSTPQTNFQQQQQPQLSVPMQNNISLQHQQHNAQFQAAQQQLMQQQAAVAAANLQNRNTQMYQQQQMQMGGVGMGNVGMQGMVGQQHIPHQGLNGGWQSDKDTQDRRKMIAKIVQLLQQRKPNAPQEWLKKLPQMAKRLEESLYRSAPSFESYNDFNTLKQRLQQLAMNIGMNKTKNKGQMVQQTNQFVQQPLMQQQQRQAPTQQLNGMNMNIQLQQPSLQQPQMPAVPQQPPQRQMVNMHDINPIMSQPQNKAPQAPPPQPLQDNSMPQVNSMNNFNQNIGNNSVGSDLLNGIQNQQIQQPQLMNQSNSNNQRQNSSAPAPSTNGAVNTGLKPGSDRQQVLRHQQQRLLLLRHAAKCPHQDGVCPVTPHCAGMKCLWKHIAECKDQKCLVPHCVSSRYVLSHYHRCKDVRCPVCGPVREAIHRSHEKAKLQQMQSMKGKDGQQTKTQTLQQPFLQDQVIQNAGVPLPAPLGTNITSPTDLQPQKRRKTSITLNQNNIQSSNNMMNAINLPRQQQQQLPMQPLVEPIMQLQQPKPFMQTPQQQPQPQQALSQPTQGITPQTTPSSIPQPNQNQETVPQPICSAPPVTSSAQASTPTETISASETASPAPQEDHTLINCFTNEQIETHIASLNKGLQLPPQKLKTKCLDVLKVLQAHQHGWVFNAPVDPVELGLPDYFHVIKRPMDLGTIKKRLENGCYHSITDFEADVHLTFDNAMLYNQEGSVVYNMAREMKEKFTADFELLIGQLNAEEDEKRKNGDACSLCGCEKLLFEPPVFYCNGINCPSKRIRRNTYYYVGGNNQFHWCHQCFGELKDNQTIEIGDLSTKKNQLVKKKNDEVHEESWVQCDKCERWIHQICALFNTRQNKDQRSEYTCPRCTIQTRNSDKGTKRSRIPMAKDLPRTKLSEWLEDHVTAKTENFLENFIKDKADTENIDVEEARKQVNSGPITIRQVTSMDRRLDVRDRMRNRYAFRNYPSEFTYRCKCIVVFQNLDGVDVILFGLYVYEHDENNPPPNQRAVYISYLDSVHYMRPRKMRTFVYHEILIAYLDYVRRKGYSTAHIWACPPLKGDDYILYAKPEDQKTPKDDRLRQWYLDMLYDAQKRGIVGRLTNMYDLYFSNEKHDASIVPYMEGDYFPAEAENIIKDIEEGKNGKKSGSGGKKNKSKSKDRDKKNSSSTRGGTRSSGIDEEALAASGIIPTGMEKKSLEEGGRDYVMAKLGETIYPMRESFIVAFLCWEGAKEENLVVPKEIEEYRVANNITYKLPPKTVSSNEQTDSKGDNPVYDDDENGESRKRDIEGNQVKPDPAPSSSAAVKSYKVTDDDIEELDCEFLNNRQAFLNLCQGNHYQFDQLRRAKHTSMMVLWHLHNRDAPKFVQQCAVCSREILTGYRYHCPICADYDQCQQCFNKTTTPRHPHQLKPIAIGQQNELTEAQRKERQRSIQLHMQLLYHAATCVSPKCPSANCTKMKGLLKHGAQCQIKAAGGCHVCKRIWALLQIHARQCKQNQCPVPNCMAIRERFRQLKQQQQAMDDRRRQNMNLAYRGAAR